MKYINALRVFGGVVLAAAGMLALETTASAAAPATPASIAFEFTADGTVHPAGQYYFEEMTGAGVVSMRDAEGHRVCFLTKKIGDYNTNADPKLVFRWDGARYELSEVWMSQSSGGGAVPVKAPAKLARGANGAKTITVALAR